MNRSIGPTALEAIDVRFVYPDGIVALAGVSLRVGQGEFVVIMGANGSGKTTLMKVFLGLLRPRQGVVRLGAGDINCFRPAELYRRVGMVFQNPSDQLFASTVELDVAFGPRNLGLSEAEVTRRVEESLAAVDALALRGRPIHHLSYGQQKRVSLAGVLAMRPDILLLDEPTAGLDPAGESQMIDLLVRLNRSRGATLVLSTQSVDLLPVLADRVCVLAQGRVWQEGTPREVFADPCRIAQAGLRVPLVTQLFQDLCGRQGKEKEDRSKVPERPERCRASTGQVPFFPERLPLTVAEARREIVRWLAETRIGCSEDRGSP